MTDSSSGLYYPVRQAECSSGSTSISNTSDSIGKLIVYFVFLLCLRYVLAFMSTS